MGDRTGRPGYRQRMQRLMEERLVPKGLQLGPQLELLGSRELTIWRHTGLLEYGDSRVLVLAGDSLYQVEGHGLTITAMNRDMLGIRGEIMSVQLIGDPS